MFRRFSLFDSSPPPARISINPPRLNKIDRKLPLRSAINTLHLEMPLNPTLLDQQEAKRSKSLDHSANLGLLKNQSAAKYRAKSVTLPPIINRQLPQASSPTSHRWYNRLGNSFRRNAWSRRAPVQYQVIIWQHSPARILIAAFTRDLKMKTNSNRNEIYDLNTRLLFTFFTTDP